MSKFTPGPWVVEATQQEGFPEFGTSFDVIASDDLPICWVARKDDPEANARLIAAAPLLLDACKTALSYFDRCSEGPMMTSVQMFETLQNAIAKAEQP